ncbi:MAG TPA: SH3 domain-containing protein [Kiritimatiellia bacterium]|nr:SH3 domain-containing protein [Kiritimatiellia bacterium]
MSRCNSTWLRALFFAVVLAGVRGAAAEELLARVTSDRVNLRARPDLAAEVVAQVNTEDRLTVVSMENDWVQVVPPDSVDVWAHRDFVKDGASTVKTLNLRAGPGINYTIVGSVARGEPVPVRGQFGEWLKVAPANTTLWVSRELVELVSRVPAPPPVVPVGPVSELPVLPSLDPAGLPPPSPRTPDPAAPSMPPVAMAPPADLNLVPLQGQGREVRREGELKPAPFLFGRPSPFRLVRREGVQQVTVCYVRGNTAQLNSLLNESLIIHGREYWVQGVKQPVVVLERIERRSP